MKHALINIAMLISVSIFALVGCSSTNTRQQNTGIGAVSGAVVGGLAGSLVGGGAGKAVAVVGGAVVGALIGGYIGKNMDSSDNAAVSTTLSNNRSNQATTWTNPNTGARYTVRPTSSVFAYNGYNYCRRYYTSAFINGKKQTTRGIACQQSNGTWVTVR